MAINIRITPEQRLQKAVAFLLSFKGLEALSGILMIGERHVGNKNQTACTDGVNSWYNPDFMATLTDPELRFVIVHEEFHKMFRHLVTWAFLWKKNAQAANAACDYVINLMIYDLAKRDNFKYLKPPECILLDEQYRGMNALQVFNKIMDDAKNNPPPEQGDGDPQQGDGDPQQGDSSTSVDGIPQGHDDHDWEAAQDMSEAEQEKVSEQIDQAIRQGKMRADAAGSESGSMSEAIKDLLEPKVNWREVLRQFVHSHCSGQDLSTWRRPRRRYIASGLYMPSTYSERVEEVMDASDTSGSMWSYQSAVRSEVKAIMDMVKPEVMHHVDWDTSVQQHVIIKDGDEREVEGLDVKGGGGTDVRCVSAYLRNNKLAPKVLVILTDGYLSGGWGSWPKDTHILWVIFGNKSCRPPMGQTLHVDERDFH